MLQFIAMPNLSDGLSTWMASLSSHFILISQTPKLLVIPKQTLSRTSRTG